MIGDLSNGQVSRDQLLAKRRRNRLREGIAALILLAIIVAVVIARRLPAAADSTPLPAPAAGHAELGSRF
jgi:hypothetical protein